MLNNKKPTNWWSQAKRASLNQKIAADILHVSDDDLTQTVAPVFDFVPALGTTCFMHFYTVFNYILQNTGSTSYAKNLLDR